MSSLTQNMLFSYKKTLLSLIYQFSIGRFSYISFYVVNPPRLREKLTCFFLIIFNRRITPACAGKTSSALICLSWSWDHPRVCGKNISDILKMVRVLGSPPLLREKRISTPFVQVNCGITPACAGKTFDSIWECQSC